MRITWQPSRSSNEGRGCPSGSNEGRGFPSVSNEGRGCPSGSNEGRGCPSGSNEGRGYPSVSNEGRGYPSGSNEGRGCPSASNEGRVIVYSVVLASKVVGVQWTSLIPRPHRESGNETSVQSLMFTEFKVSCYPQEQLVYQENHRECSSVWHEDPQTCTHLLATYTEICIWKGFVKLLLLVARLKHKVAHVSITN